MRYMNFIKRWSEDNIETICPYRADKFSINFDIIFYYFHYYFWITLQMIFVKKNKIRIIRRNSTYIYIYIIFNNLHISFNNSNYYLSTIVSFHRRLHYTFFSFVIYPYVRSTRSIQFHHRETSGEQKIRHTIHM